MQPPEVNSYVPVVSLRQREVVKLPSSKKIENSLDLIKNDIIECTIEKSKSNYQFGRK